MSRIAYSVALRHSLSATELPDLVQDITLVLLCVGMDHTINATWVFHTAAHKAVDLHRQRHLTDAELSENQVVTYESQDPELLHLLRARVETLPGPLIDFYELRYKQGLSERVIAERLGLGRSSIRCMDRRLVHLLRGKLAC